jgi:hypothetical protein
MGFMGGAFKVDAADFDGTNDYMTRTTLVGVADSKSGIFAAWVRWDGGDGIADRILALFETFNGWFCLRRSDNKFGIGGHNTAGTEILLLVTTSTFLAGATWRYFLASWDLASAAGHLYVNDVSDLAAPTLTNDTIDYTKTGVSLGAHTTGVFKLNGALAEVYFAPGQYLDFSVEANRRKFIKSDGKPAYLGINGSKPTGTAPLIYQHLKKGEAVANFATNRGTGGDFTITGTLDTASTSPSD